MVYDDEKIVDEENAKAMAVEYSCHSTKVATQNVLPPPPVQMPEPTTNQLLRQILFELRALRADLEKRKSIRLRF